LTTVELALIAVIALALALGLWALAGIGLDIIRENRETDP
jgi:hypothetical protein